MITTILLIAVGVALAPVVGALLVMVCWCLFFIVCGAFMFLANLDTYIFKLAKWVFSPVGFILSKVIDLLFVPVLMPGKALDNIFDKKVVR